MTTCTILAHRRLALAIAATGLCACTATTPVITAPATPTATQTMPAASPASIVANGDFEAAPPGGSNCPPQWHCTMHADPKSFGFVVDEAVAASGKRSLRIERLKNEPWGLAFQNAPVADLRGRAMRLSAKVRVADATGGGGGLFLAIDSPTGLALHEQRLSNGTREWHAATIEFVVPANATRIRIGAIQEGPGRTWIDDVSLVPGGAR